MEFLSIIVNVYIFFFFLIQVSLGGIMDFLSGNLGKKLLCLYQSSYKEFKDIFFKIRSSKTKFPFFLDEHGLERFPLYYNFEAR